MSDRSPITTHVLDTSAGRPAAGVSVALFRVAGADVTELARGNTNPDGRVEGLLPPGSIEPGDYQLVFDTAAYFRAQSADSFYPRVTIDFTIASADEHYHVPLLLSPFGYATYRGS